jgi:hypothetical protein
MTENEHQHIVRPGAPGRSVAHNLPTHTAPTMSSEEEPTDVDEPPDLERTPRPSSLKLRDSFKASFSKSKPRCERKVSLLSSALHSDNSSPTDEQSDSRELSRGLSYISTWSNASASPAELTSDGGLTSPGTRTNTPSPPLPPSTFQHMVPILNNKPFEPRVTIARQGIDEEHVGLLQKTAHPAPLGEKKVEVDLGRKRCISFACGPKTERKAEPAPSKPAPIAEQTAEPPKRACTIKFACPTKISSDAPSKDNKPRAKRVASPAPVARPRASPKPQSKSHRGSDATVRNASPIATRKKTPDHTRRLSSNSELAKCEAFRFHEFASSEEEIEEWTLESTCHRQPLTIKDTLLKENNLRKLGEEAEEEAVEEEDEDLDEGEDEELDLDLSDDDQDGSDAQEDVSSDEGFQTDDEEGFAVSDDDSDAGSDYNWWTPGYSTAATSIEHLEHIRPTVRRSVSESSIGSVESGVGTGTMRYRPEKTIKRRSSRPVNIRIPSPELPDSTDFVCGTLDEDRPLEEAYLSAIERRRAAKHKTTPQDVDPTFPTSDPEMDEEDDDDVDDQPASESDAHLMMLGHMDPDGDHRGRRRSATAKRSPLPSPKRLRSPPPAKRIVHRSPPPRKLFGQSPKRLRSPPAPARLRSPPPTRRGSAIVLSPRNPGLHIQFTGLAERPALTVSSSLPRTPVTAHTPDFDEEDDEDTPNEFPMRRAIDIKVGLEKRRQRRKEQLYKKMHRKGTKDKRPAPGKGCERMREVGLGIAAHKGRATGFGFNAQPSPDPKDMRILSV